MAKRTLALFAAALSMLVCVPASGGLFEDILGFPGRVVGSIVGPGIKASLDPLLDGAASRLRKP